MDLEGARRMRREPERPGHSRWSLLGRGLAVIGAAGVLGLLGFVT
jgi:hypothetical protein